MEEIKVAESFQGEAPRADVPREEGEKKPYEREDNSYKENLRMPRFKKKVCKFCHNKEIPIDYKRSDILEKFLTDRGKILPRRITGTCAKHQRRIALEVKKARMIALLPFIEQ